VYIDRFERRRKVTLNELLDAVEEAFKAEAKRETKRAMRPSSETLQIGMEVEKIDVERIIQDVYDDLLEHSDEYGLVNFWDISGETPKDKVITLLAVLYLRTNNLVDITQEKLFGDILIRVIDREKSIAKMTMVI